MNLQSYHQQLWDYHLQLWGELCMSTDRLTPPEIDKPTPSPTTVDDLPSETLHLVCEHIHDDPATLKNLRLVSGKFNKVAITHLFHTILLYQHPGSWAKLNNINSQPLVANLVRRLQVASIGHLTHTGFDKESPRWNLRLRVPVPAGRITRARPIKLEHTVDPNTDYVRYSESQWGHRKSARWHGTFARDGYFAATGLFLPPRLESVETVGLELLHPGITRDGFDRLAATTGVSSWIRLKADSWAWKAPTNHHISMVISAMRTARLPTSLTLHRYFEIIDHDENMTWRLNPRELELDFHPLKSMHQEGLTRDLEETGGHVALTNFKVASWMHHLDNLETLTLSQRTHDGMGVNIVKVLTQVNLPKLWTVRFRNLYSRNRDTEDFVMHHGATLRRLVIDRPYYPSYKSPESRQSLYFVCSAHNVNLTFTGIKVSD